MKTDLKRHIMRLMNTQGHCLEIKRALFCKRCGPNLLKAKELLDRLQRESPELLYQRPEFEPSKETKEMFGKLMERIKKDKLYRQHIEKMARGIEVDEELDKVNKGFYRGHYEKDGNIITI